MDNSLEQKQMFLRKEILENQYDGNEFMMFLTDSNPQKGDDLERWTYQQLVTVVAAFKHSKQSPKLQPPKEVVEASLEESPLKKSNALEDGVYFEEIKCEPKLINSIYSQGKILKIKVIRWDKVQGGFLQRSYVRYTIEVPQLKAIVQRRYSQFQWMRDTLALLHPGLPIPPIAKKGKVVRVEEKYLNKRMYILQRYLNAIASIPELCSEVLFEKFLTISDPKQFQKLKNLYSKIQTVPVRKIKTISGTINISTEKQMSTKVNKYLDYLRESQPEMKKIYKNFKGVATSFEQATDYLKAISLNCQTLSKKEDLMRSNLDLPTIKENSALSVLGSLATQYADQLAAHAKTFRKEIYSLTKYQSLYKLNMIESWQLLNQKHQQYLQSKLNLMKKKQKLFTEGKVNKWGLKEKDIPRPASKQQAFFIMLPKETNELMAQRQTYALYNAQLYQQCYRHTVDFQKLFTPYLVEFLELQLSISSQITNYFNQHVTSIKQVQQISLKS